MLLTSDLAVMDHWEGSVLLIANAIRTNDRETGVDEAYADAVARLDAMEADLSRPVAQPPAALPPSELPEYTALGRPRLPAGGRGHQGTHPRGRSLPGRPLPAVRDAVHRQRPRRVPGAAGHRNPSPYMYLLRFDGFDVVGSSPEALVKVEDGRAMLHPIAGTRHRGRHPPGGPGARRGTARRPQGARRAPDAVYLGLQSLGRVCEPGSVEVVDFMSVERHPSHDIVDGHRTRRPRPHRLRRAHRLLPGRHPLRRPQAARPADHRRTLTLPPGPAPGGCVGYLDFADSDTAIAIRTALLRDGTAHVQAGAGIVADSDPVAEDTECRNKAAAVLRAVHTANRLAR
ncbi:Anthranilate synthase component 1 OS=Streptomyces fumanus OX=67302 GN=trpE PE=3 SV=1 [Streptomyces fumanus]